MNHDCCCGLLRLRTAIRIVGLLICLFSLVMIAAASYFWIWTENLQALVVFLSLGFIYLPTDVAFLCMVCTSKFHSIFSRKFFRGAILFAFVVQLLAGLTLEALLVMTTYYLSSSNQYYQLGYYIFALYSAGLGLLMFLSIVIHCVVLRLTSNYIELGRQQLSHVVEKPP